MSAAGTRLFKVLAAGQASCHGGSGKWRKGQWRTVKGDLVPCENGIHYCRADQLIHWLGPTIWLFEDGAPDETIDHGDKMVTRKGRIVERVEAWTPQVAQQVCYRIADVAVRETAADALEAAGYAKHAKSLRALPPITDAASARAASDAAWAASNAARAASIAAWAASAAARAASDTARAASIERSTAILFSYLDGAGG